MEKTESYTAQRLEYEQKLKELRDLIQYFHDELENTNKILQTKIDKLELEIEERRRLVLELKTFIFDLEISNSKLEQSKILANQENESHKVKQESKNMRKKAEKVPNKKNAQIPKKDCVIENLVKREKELAKNDAEFRLRAHKTGRQKANLSKNASDRQSLTRMTKETDLNWLSYI